MWGNTWFTCLYNPRYAKSAFGMQSVSIRDAIDYVFGMHSACILFAIPEFGQPAALRSPCLFPSMSFYNYFSLLLDVCLHSIHLCAFIPSFLCWPSCRRVNLTWWWGLKISFFTSSYQTSHLVVYSTFPDIILYLTVLNIICNVLIRDQRNKLCLFYFYWSIYLKYKHGALNLDTVWKS